MVVDDDVTVSKEEEEFLNLGMKFRMVNKMDLHKAEVEIEKWTVKNRWTLQDIKDKEKMDEENIEERTAETFEDGRLDLRMPSTSH